MSNVNVIYSFTGEYQFLSNMYPCDIEYGGFKYSCVENAFQAQKTVDEKEKLFFLYVSPYIACNPEKGQNNLGKILMKIRSEL